MPRTAHRIGLCASVFSLTYVIPAWVCAQAYPHQAASTKADVVYVVGAVNKPGGYVLEKRETVTILGALDLAGGLTKTASKSSARILRHGSTVAIPIDLNKALQGKAQDIELGRGDILFIPDKNPARPSTPYQDPPMMLPHKDRNQRLSAPA
jgi:SLBB domain-containing protein